MPRKKRPKISLAEKLRKIKKAGIENKQKLNHVVPGIDDIPELNERIAMILNVFEHHKIKRNTMLFFVMYDIEDNKVRTHIAKYLIKKGCVRIQKSIYIADQKPAIYREIHDTLREVQDIYDNKDSIILVPISTDEMRAMKIIGENIDFDMSLGNKNTLFF